jgi:hypothetical protein
MVPTSRHSIGRLRSNQSGKPENDRASWIALAIWNILNVIPSPANHLIHVCGPTVALGHKEVKRLADETMVADSDIAPLPLHRTSLPLTKEAIGEAVFLPRV